MEYTLTFSEQQMHILNMALGEIPHKHAAPLIASINDQIMKATQGQSIQKEVNLKDLKTEN